MQATYVWIHYVLVTAWPVGLQPAPTELIDFDPWTATFLVRAVLVLGTTAALLLLGRRRRLPLLLWLAWLSLLVPALGLTEHPMFACDRYASLPGLVPAVLAGAAVLWLGTTPARRRVVALSSAALLALLGGLAHAQARTWRDSVTLFEHMLPLLGEHPFRVGIFASLGSAYLEQGRYAEAVAPLRQAALFLPDEVATSSNLGYALWLSGRPAEAVPPLEAAVRFAPARLDVRCQLASVLVDAGRPEDARREALLVLRFAPGTPCAQQVLDALDARPRP
jgi:tetratricopeptide (TPR) repeat protein